MMREPETPHMILFFMFLLESSEPSPVSQTASAPEALCDLESSSKPERTVKVITLLFDFCRDMLALPDKRKFLLETGDVLEAPVDAGEPDISHFVEPCQLVHDQFADP